MKTQQPKYKLIDCRILKDLGHGQYGYVYLAELKENKNVRLAIKQCSLNINDRAKEYLIREVAILASLNHPNINRFYSYEIDTQSQTLTLFLEYCNGGDLQKSLERYQSKYKKPLSEELCQYLLRQIALGLQAMHNLNIVHRDLKPGNVLLHYENEQDRREMNLLKAKVKIADFGFARYLDSNELAESRVGTPFFADPRIFIVRNERYGKEVDVWSFGVVAFQLLTGTLPFLARDIVDLGDKITAGQFSIPSEVELSEESVSFIQCALVENSEMRWEINDLVRHLFFAKSASDFTRVLDKRKASDNQVWLNIYNLEESLVAKNNLMDVSICKQEPQRRTDLPYDKVKEELRRGLEMKQPQIERKESYEERRKGKENMKGESKAETKAESKMESKEVNDSFHVNEELEKKLKKCFLEMNEDFLYFKPKIAPSFPYEPEELKELQLDVRMEMD